VSRRRNLPPGVCRLGMDPWAGPRPLPGHYLATEKGHTAYLVLSIKPKRKGAGFQVECERNSRASLPDDAVIHWFIWNKR
jgi:hypothetical protein